MFLYKYMQYVYDLKFEEDPDYGYLKFVLEKNLLDQETIPDNKFDWTIRKRSYSQIYKILNLEDEYDNNLFTQK